MPPTSPSTRVRPDTPVHVQKQLGRHARVTTPAASVARDHAGDLPSDFGLPIAIHVARTGHHLRRTDQERLQVTFPAGGQAAMYRSRTGRGAGLPLTKTTRCNRTTRQRATTARDGRRAALDGWPGYFGTTGGHGLSLVCNGGDRMGADCLLTCPGCLLGGSPGVCRSARLVSAGSPEEPGRWARRVRSRWTGCRPSAPCSNALERLYPMPTGTIRDWGRRNSSKKRSPSRFSQPRREQQP